MARRRYAKIWWMVEDITDLAKEYEVEVTKDVARQLLESNEKRLEETTIAAGWTVIQEALAKLPHSTQFRRTPD